MAVSIWEGNKAQALIEAIRQGEKVDKQQGIGNAGKALVVGDDGIVTTRHAALSNIAIQALLNCFAHVTWVDEYGKNYYDLLEAALKEDGGYTPSGVLKIYNKNELTFLYGSINSIAQGVRINQTVQSNYRYVVGIANGDPSYIDANLEPLNLGLIPIPEGAKSVIVFATANQASGAKFTCNIDISTRAVDSETGIVKYFAKSTGTQLGSTYLNLDRGETHLTISVTSSTNDATYDSTIGEDFIRDITIVFLSEHFETSYDYKRTNNYDPITYSRMDYAVEDNTLKWVESTVRIAPGFNSGVRLRTLVPFANPQGSIILKPKDATAVTATVSPSTLQIKIATINFDYETFTFTPQIIHETQFTTQSVTLNLTDDENGIIVLIKKADGSTIATTDVSGIIVEFDRE